MDFREPQHQAIAEILARLNPDFFWSTGATFGGGTLITLQHNEYRVSYDIDFIADETSYSKVRQGLPLKNATPLFIGPVEPDGDVSVDRYKVLFALNRIKFEIVHEARISLEAPVEWMGLPVLSPLDQIATKLLANSDRWNDQRAGGRDLIDLCVLIQALDCWEDGYAKAMSAINANPVADNLLKALDLADTTDQFKDALEIFGISNTQLIYAGLEQIMDFV